MTIIPMSVSRHKPTNLEIEDYLRKVGTNPLTLAEQVLKLVHTERWLIGTLGQVRDKVKLWGDGVSPECTHFAVELEEILGM